MINKNMSTGRKKGIFYYGIFDKKMKMRDYINIHNLAIFTRKKDAIKYKIDNDKIYRIQLVIIKEIKK